jgi:DNA polymerase III delta prime subunit
LTKNLFLGQNVIGNRVRLKELDELIKGKSCPHVLLAGIYGTGKTTISLVIAKEITKGSKLSNPIKIIKGTLQGSIELLRTVIEDFCSYSLEKGRKVLIIEEVDDASKKFKSALRNQMEEWSRKGIVVIMNCNYKEEIDEPVVNRCFVMDFSRVPDNEMTILLERIKKSKNLTISEDGVKALLLKAEGIPRTLVTIMQVASGNGTKPITAEIVSKTPSNGTETILPVIKAAMAGKFENVDEETAKIINSSTFSERQIINLIFYYFLKKDLTKDAETNKIFKRSMIRACAEVDFRMKKGAAPLIQINYLATELFDAYRILKLSRDKGVDKNDANQ